MSQYLISLCDFVNSFGGVRFVLWLIAVCSILVLSYFNYKKKLKQVRNEIEKLVRNEHFMDSNEAQPQPQPQPQVKVQDKIERRFKEAKFFKKIMYFVVTFVALIGSTYFIFFFLRHPLSNSVAEWGQMGDFFGGMLNPILAFASFIALLYTIRIQMEELKLTRAELKNTSNIQKEIAKTANDELEIVKKNNKVQINIQVAMPLYNILRENISKMHELLQTEVFFHNDTYNLAHVMNVFSSKHDIGKFKKLLNAQGVDERSAEMFDNEKHIIDVLNVLTATYAIAWKAMFLFEKTLDTEETREMGYSMISLIIDDFAEIGFLLYITGLRPDLASYLEKNYEKQDDFLLDQFAIKITASFDKHVSGT